MKKWKKKKEKKNRMILLNEKMINLTRPNEGRAEFIAETSTIIY